MSEESERPYLSVVVPMFNEEKVACELHRQLTDVLRSLGKSYEIVFVDDGSTDATLDVLAKIQREDLHVVLIELRGNFGQTPALAAGFENARGDVVIAMDGDLQHLPQDLPAFVAKVEEGYDVVSGWRADRKDNFISRRLPSRIANWAMAKISGVPIHDFGTTFKAYRRDILQEIKLYGEFHRFIPVLAARVRARICEIPIVNVRGYRKSHYNIGRTFTVFFDLIRINFLSRYLARPLEIFGSLGLLLSLAGVGLASYLVVLKYAYGLPLLQYRGPLFILSILLIVLGVMFIILGLLGEMIVKLFHDYSNVRIYSIRRIRRHDPMR